MNAERFRQLQEMFHASLARPPEEREVFVREVTEGDDGLRQELLSLLAAHREGDAFLENGLKGGGGPLVEGQRIGSYQVLREIGRGGMGIVYLGKDTRLNRQVALKVLAPELVLDTRQQERFRREAMAAGSLSHPAIATVYALEEAAGRFYIVSEYVPGEPLTVEASEAPLPFRRVLDIGLQIASALCVAHERGVVHRDLKPENILWVDERQLKIVDFGLAIGPGPTGEQQRLTRPDMLIGTPAYMSPEQLRGEVVDFRSDLFCLGILLYELAIGEHPFENGTVLATTSRILESEPPGVARLRMLVPGLDRIILRCLEKSPEARFGSTRAVVDELERLAGDAPQTLPTANTSGREKDDTSHLRGYWWVVHQCLVIALYATMIVLCFIINAQYQLGPVLWSAFLTLACGIWNGAMRAHLLFTWRFNRSALPGELARTSGLVWPVDLVFTLLLIVSALSVLPESQPWAATLASVAVGYAVVFLVVEPTTSRSVFEPGNPRER